MQRSIRILPIAIALLAASPVSQAAPYAVERVDVSRMLAVKKFDGLTETAIRLRTALPRPSWDWLERAGVAFSLEGRGGQLRGNNRSSFVLGTSLVGRWETWRAGAGYWLELGTGPTWLERYRFGDGDLGGPLQFTSHVAIGYRPAFLPGLGISLRLQHISNGGIKHSNPGVDMLGVTVSWHPDRPRPR